MKLSASQEDDLLWFYRHGGDGVMDRYGRVVAGGSVKAQGHTATFLRLVAWGLVEGNGAGRLSLTARGREEAARIDGDRREAEARLAALVERWDDGEEGWDADPGEDREGGPTGRPGP